MKTLSDVLRDSGISYRTLVKYVEMRLIPKPQRVWRGRKGSQSLYPDDIIDTIKRIRKEQKDGLTLRQIAENWKVGRAMDAFAELMTKYPNYYFVSGKVIEEKANPDGSIVVTVKVMGVKRR